MTGVTPETVMTTKAPTVLRKSHIVLETKVPKCINWYKTQETLVLFVDGSDKHVKANFIFV